MMGNVLIDDLPGRMTAIRAALNAAFPALVHHTSYRRDLSDYAPEELRTGVLNLVSSEESDYSEDLGMEAREGMQQLALVIRFRVDGDDDGESVEATELDLAEQIKTFCRTGVSGLRLRLVRLYTSAQQETPYGYVVANLESGPPRETLN